MNVENENAKNVKNTKNITITGDFASIGEKIQKKFAVPGDKSISHRSVMFGAMASGTTEVTGFLTGADCLSTISCFRKLGVDIIIDEKNPTNVLINGTGKLQPSTAILDVGNSGTTLRLMAGLLAGQAFASTLTGDDSIKKRPMKRVVEPLTLMGANISGVYAPVTINPPKQPLHGIEYTLPVASAQVKSAILLASLYASPDEKTIIHEPIATRDHTEKMLNYFGANISRDGTVIISKPILQPLRARPVAVPGDISSAAFWLAAAAILPNCELTICDVGVNPTRAGIIAVLQRMGAKIELQNPRNMGDEPVADIFIKQNPLKATTISGDEIPTLIDEIPAIAAVALFAEGETVIKDAQELRVKETDRIKVVMEEFGKFFVAKNPITPHDDGMTINGVCFGENLLHGATVDSHGDHRLAMILSILAMAAHGETVVVGADCADVSFPGFYEMLPQENIKM
ncbi:MAG: 3-phosphoshikimate 1-carboxyvinyltransferase [Defluviitaleaceae bacterium]|nr:3-phosphoshikimate 1-carboxyvinyltransferase [Defluviitaleaceae bacterium]